MKTKILVAVIVVSGLFLLLPTPEEKIHRAPQEAQKLNNNFVITNVRLYDGFEVFEKTDVMIKDNKIEAIGDNLPSSDNMAVIDASGQTLLPGLIDAHTHAYGNAMVDALNFGVTTELDMFTMPAFAQNHFSVRESETNTQQADLFSATILATTTNGHGTQFGFDIPVLNHVEEVEQFVLDRIADGADYIKAVYNAKQAQRQHFPSVSYEVIAELIKIAHQNNRMLVVHVDNLVSAQEVIDLGADGIIHSFMDQIVDDKLISSMKKNNAFIIPTLSVQASVTKTSTPDFKQDKNINKHLNKQQIQQLNANFPDFGIPKDAYKIAEQSVAALSSAGINVMAGSDAPNPGTTHGISLHGELMLLVKAGLSEEQAIHSATGAVGKHFDIGLRGTLTPGALASMVLVNGNPFDDIKLTQNIERIWKNGHEFQRLAGTNKNNTNPIINAGIITDFNKSITETQYGSGIIKSTDQMAGGNSVVELTQVAHKENSDHYLNVKGEIIKGFMYRWSGFSFIPANDPMQAVNLSEVNQLVFDAKSTKADQPLALLLFEKGSFQPKTQVVDLTTEWQNYAVDLSNFKAADLNNVSNISFVISQLLGKFEFMIDNIELK